MRYRLHRCGDTRHGRYSGSKACRIYVTTVQRFCDLFAGIGRHEKGSMPPCIRLRCRGSAFLFCPGFSLRSNAFPMSHDDFRLVFWRKLWWGYGPLLGFATADEFLSNMLSWLLSRLLKNLSALPHLALPYPAFNLRVCTGVWCLFATTARKGYNGIAALPFFDAIDPSEVRKDRWHLVAVDIYSKKLISKRDFLLVCAAPFTLGCPGWLAG